MRNLILLYKIRVEIMEGRWNTSASGKHQVVVM
jgi:hypothetical protein